MSFRETTDIQPDPVDQNGLRLLVGIVEPVKSKEELQFKFHFANRMESR